MSKSNQFSLKKDENGRFIDAKAYLPRTIGVSIVEAFSGMKLPKEAGIDVLNCLLGNTDKLSAKCDNPRVRTAITNLGEDIKDMFLAGGCTSDEFNAGVVDVFSQINDNEELSDLTEQLKKLAETLGEDDDNSQKLH